MTSTNPTMNGHNPHVEILPPVGKEKEHLESFFERIKGTNGQAYTAPLGKKEKDKQGGWLRRLTFANAANFAAGAGVVILSKSAAGAVGAATLGVGTGGLLALTAIAGGIATAEWKNYQKNMALKKAGEEYERFFSVKRFAKKEYWQDSAKAAMTGAAATLTAGVSSVAAALGSQEYKNFKDNQAKKANGEAYKTFFSLDRFKSKDYWVNAAVAGGLVLAGGAVGYAGMEVLSDPVPVDPHSPEGQLALVQQGFNPDGPAPDVDDVNAQLNAVADKAVTPEPVVIASIAAGDEMVGPPAPVAESVPAPVIIPEEHFSAPEELAPLPALANASTADAVTVAESVPVAETSSQDAAAVTAAVVATSDSGSIGEILTKLSQEQHSPKTEALIERAMNGDKGAMGTVAKALFNGERGFDQDRAAALTLYQGIGDKVNEAYINYHGFGVVEADPAKAIAMMKEVNTPVAKEFVAQWTGAHPTHVPPVQVIHGGPAADAVVAQAQAPVQASAPTPVASQEELPWLKEKPVSVQPAQAPLFDSAPLSNAELADTFNDSSTETVPALDKVAVRDLDDLSPTAGTASPAPTVSQQPTSFTQCEMGVMAKAEVEIPQKGFRGTFNTLTERFWGVGQRFAPGTTASLTLGNVQAQYDVIGHAPIKAETFINKIFSSRGLSPFCK